MKRWVFFVLGLLLSLIGIVWILQGVGVITGSFMTGQRLWFFIGIGVLLVGVILAGSTIPNRGRTK